MPPILLHASNSFLNSSILEKLLQALDNPLLEGNPCSFAPNYSFAYGYGKENGLSEENECFSEIVYFHISWKRNGFLSSLKMLVYVFRYQKDHIVLVPLILMENT